MKKVGKKLLHFTEYSILTGFITGFFSGSGITTGCILTQLVNLFFKGGLEGGTMEDVSPPSSVSRRFFSGVDILFFLQVLFF